MAEKNSGKPQSGWATLGSFIGSCDYHKIDYCTVRLQVFTSFLAHSCSREEACKNERKSLTVSTCLSVFCVTYDTCQKVWHDDLYVWIGIIEFQKGVCVDVGCDNGRTGNRRLSFDEWGELGCNLELSREELRDGSAFKVERRESSFVQRRAAEWEEVAVSGHRCRSFSAALLWLRWERIWAAESFSLLRVVGRQWEALPSQGSDKEVTKIWTTRLIVVLGSLVRSFLF